MNLEDLEKNPLALEQLQSYMADDWMIDAMDPVYGDQNEQSVPDPTMPFVNQTMMNYPAYPTLDTTPGWMNVSQFTTDSAITGENGSTYDVESELSPAASSTGSFAFTEYEPFGPVDNENFKKIIARIGVTEKTLQEFSVKELNRFLKSNELSKVEQKCLKNRRRTLKNRGYAQNCRIKRIKVKKTLEIDNESLQKEVDELRGCLERTKRERDLYKDRLGKIVKFLKSQKSVKVV